MKRIRWILPILAAVLMAGTAYAALVWTPSWDGRATGAATGGMGITAVDPVTDGFHHISPKVTLGGDLLDESDAVVGSWKGTVVVAYYGAQAVLTGDIELTLTGELYRGEIGGVWIWSDDTSAQNFHAALRAHKGTGKNKVDLQGFAAGRIEDGGNNPVDLNFYLGTAAVTS